MSTKGVDNGVINMYLLRDDEGKWRQEAPSVETHAAPAARAQSRCDGRRGGCVLNDASSSTFCEHADAEDTDAVGGGKEDVDEL